MSSVAMLERHYKPKKISKIEKSDRRVAIVGKVRKVNEDGNSFVLDDDTGKIEIFSDKLDKVKKGGIVRVFCTIENEKLNADVVQSLESLDLNLFKKVEELYIKAGV